MKIVILTEESKVKFPPIDTWHNRIGRGINIKNDQKFVELLRENNLKVPSNDIELENEYRNILYNYIRPANLLFAGMFSEVRHFAEQLSKNYTVETFILSGRYGLLKETEPIIPYSFHIETLTDLDSLNKSTNFCDKMKLAAKNADYIILLFPERFNKYLVQNKFFLELSDKKLIIVCSNDIKKEITDFYNIIFLKRQGVARIGEINRIKILDILKKNTTNDNFL
ncbi:hypothetical protein [Methanolobus psychrotolerans]|uniref:hypothetical protein n=1 Tax=Methanolobus psychrotolerans TaxID=1874706 RepID=UPI000B9194AC|nr:hypothetical protein [Methanolobus psychrotolerans]